MSGFSRTHTDGCTIVVSGFSRTHTEGRTILATSAAMDLHDALRGLDFPAPRNKLIAKALENGAAADVINRIRQLPETADFHNPAELEDALGVTMPEEHPGREWE